MIQAQLMGGGQEDLVEVAALEALSPHQLQGTASGELGVGAVLMKDLVAWGFKNTGQAITLNDLHLAVFDSSPLPPELRHRPHGVAETDPAQPGASRPQLPGGAADHRRQHRA